MKKNTHPAYRDVLFIDSSTGHKFVCGSSLKTDKVETYEGKEYPAFYASISSASHPFFTGSTKMMDAEGRVLKFMKRYENVAKKREEQVQEIEAKEATLAQSAKKKK